MNLKQTRLVTNDVQKLPSLYERLTGATREVISADYVEFQHSPCAGLAITSAATAQVYGEGVIEKLRAERSMNTFWKFSPWPSRARARAGGVGEPGVLLA